MVFMDHFTIEQWILIVRTNKYEDNYIKTVQTLQRILGRHATPTESTLGDLSKSLVDNIKSLGQSFSSI